MQKDQRDVLLEFNAHGVKYLIVGGYAFSFYAEPRATKDLDLYISTSDQNAATVFAALAHFGAPLGGMSPEDFQNPDTWFQIGTTLSRVDIVQNIDAVDFEDAWARAVPGLIDGDIPVRFLSVTDFIANKLAVGRLRDLADVEEIRAAQAVGSQPIHPGDSDDE